MAEPDDYYQQMNEVIKIMNQGNWIFRNKYKSDLKENHIDLINQTKNFENYLSTNKDNFELFIKYFIGIIQFNTSKKNPDSGKINKYIEILHNIIINSNCAIAFYKSKSQIIKTGIIFLLNQENSEHFLNSYLEVRKEYNNIKLLIESLLSINSKHTLIKTIFNFLIKNSNIYLKQLESKHIYKIINALSGSYLSVEDKENFYSLLNKASTSKSQDFNILLMSLMKHNQDLTLHYLEKNNILFNEFIKYLINNKESDKLKIICNKFLNDSQNKEMLKKLILFFITDEEFLKEIFNNRNIINNIENNNLLEDDILNDLLDKQLILKMLSKNNSSLLFEKVAKLIAKGLQKDHKAKLNFKHDILIEIYAKGVESHNLNPNYIKILLEILIENKFVTIYKSTNKWTKYSIQCFSKDIKNITNKISSKHLKIKTEFFANVNLYYLLQNKCRSELDKNNIDNNPEEISNLYKTKYLDEIKKFELFKLPDNTAIKGYGKSYLDKLFYEMCIEKLNDNYDQKNYYNLERQLLFNETITYWINYYKYNSKILDITNENIFSDFLKNNTTYYYTFLKNYFHNRMINKSYFAIYKIDYNFQENFSKALNQEPPKSKKNTRNNQQINSINLIQSEYYSYISDIFKKFSISQNENFFNRSLQIEALYDKTINSLFNAIRDLSSEDKNIDSYIKWINNKIASDEIKEITYYDKNFIASTLIPKLKDSNLIKFLNHNPSYTYDKNFLNKLNENFNKTDKNLIVKFINYEEKEEKNELPENDVKIINPEKFKPIANSVDNNQEENDIPMEQVAQAIENDNIIELIDNYKPENQKKDPITTEAQPKFIVTKKILTAKEHLSENSELITQIKTQIVNKFLKEIIDNDDTSIDYNKLYPEVKVNCIVKFFNDVGKNYTPTTKLYSYLYNKDNNINNLIDRINIITNSYIKSNVITNLINQIPDKNHKYSLYKEFSSNKNLNGVNNTTLLSLFEIANKENHINRKKELFIKLIHSKLNFKIEEANILNILGDNKEKDVALNYIKAYEKFSYESCLTKAFDILKSTYKQYDNIESDEDFFEQIDDKIKSSLEEKYEQHEKQKLAKRVNVQPKVETVSKDIDKKPVIPVNKVNQKEELSDDEKILYKLAPDLKSYLIQTTTNNSIIFKYNLNIIVMNSRFEFKKKLQPQTWLDYQKSSGLSRFRNFFNYYFSPKYRNNYNYGKKIATLKAKIYTKFTCGATAKIDKKTYKNILDIIKNANNFECINLKYINGKISLDPIKAAYDIIKNHADSKSACDLNIYNHNNTHIENNNVKTHLEKFFSPIIKDRPKLQCEDQVNYYSNWFKELKQDYSNYINFSEYSSIFKLIECLNNNPNANIDYNIDTNLSKKACDLMKSLAPLYEINEDLTKKLQQTENYKNQSKKDIVSDLHKKINRISWKKWRNVQSEEHANNNQKPTLYLPEDKIKLIKNIANYLNGTLESNDDELLNKLVVFIEGEDFKNIQNQRVDVKTDTNYAGCFLDNKKDNYDNNYNLDHKTTIGIT